MSQKCPFCEIVAGKAPVSIVYEDKQIMCFMTLRPTRLGECLIIPKQHIDHFTDIADKQAAHIMTIAQRVGRKMLARFEGDRIGMVVHGYGVAHAHLIVLPQQDIYDITSARFAKIENGSVMFDHSQIEMLDRAVLDLLQLYITITSNAWLGRNSTSYDSRICIECISWTIDDVCSIENTGAE